MRTIDRYIVGKTCWPLAAALGVALLAFLLNRMVRLLDLVINEGGPFYLLVRMLANLVPHYLGMALPAAFFLGMLLAVMRLSADSEYDAMQAAGVGLRRLLAPLMVLAIVLTACSTVIIGYLQPHTRYAYRALVYLVTNTAWDLALEQGSFFTGFGGKTIMAEDISDRGRRLRGVFVYERSSGGRAVTATAETGQVFRTDDVDRLILSLTKGVLIETSGTDRSTTVATFERLDLPLDFNLDTIAFRSDREGYRELTLLELWAARGAPPPGMTTTRIDVEIHGRVVRIASVLFLPFLALPLGTAARRSSRSLGLSLGLVILAVYHHVVQFGGEFAAARTISPWLTVWVPYAVFAGSSIWAFHSAATRPGFNVFATLINGIQRIGAEARGLAVGTRRAA